MKSCTKCDSTTNGFHTDNRAKDGLYSACKVCRNAEFKTYAKTPEVKARRASTNRVWQKSNPEKAIAKVSRYQAASPEKIKEQNKRSKLARRRSVLVENAQRTERIVKRTPGWANRFFIKEAYHLAKLRTKVTGIVWHVDHKIPLYGKTVSGLHVENNVQVIPGKLNLIKSNTYKEY